MFLIKLIQQYVIRCAHMYTSTIHINSSYLCNVFDQ